MNLPKLSLRALLLCGAAAMVPSAIAACGSDAAEFGEAASTGESSSAQASAGASGGTGGGGGAAENPLAPACETLCTYIDQINCTAWPNCPSDCPSALGAPPECVDEYAALLDCWVANLSEFACTATQLLPPFACYELDAKFLQCLAGENNGADSGCVGQVCNGTDSLCSCKTFCGEAEYKAACSDQSGAWACSCYDGDTLLGTCNQTTVGCDNYEGCCAPFFVGPR